MTRSWLIGTIGRVVTFVLALITVDLLLDWDAAAHPDGGANIGAGLVMLAVFTIGSAVWGGWDGAHSASLVAVLARWGIVGAVLFLIELATDTPYVAGLVAVPSLALGALCRLAARPARQPEAARR